MKDYKKIFDAIETSLINEGSKHLAVKSIQANLNSFKQVEEKNFSNNDYYRALVDVVFYSGFRAATVTAKINIIHEHFQDYELIAEYGEKEIKGILADKEMIRNRRKIESCVKNAKVFKSIIQEHSTFQNYIDSFNARKSFENLFLLTEELENRFSGLGKITVYHLLTDIGFPVLKPDRVICRIFERLGFINSREQYLQTIILGRKIAEAAGHPIRYIDMVFVAFGQVQSKEFGIERGICLEINPACQLCEARSFCNHYSKKSA